MKLFALFCIPFLFSINGYNQKSFSPIAQKVQVSKITGSNLKKVSPFSRSGDVKSDLAFSDVLTSGQLLTLDPSALTALYKTKLETILLEIPSGKDETMTLELVSQRIVGTNFKVFTSSTPEQPAEYQPGIYYKGIVQNEPNSLAAISVFENFIIGVISIPKIGSIILGKIDDAKSNAYLLYQENNLLIHPEITCGANEIEWLPNMVEHIKEINSFATAKSNDKCIRVYLECDYEMFSEHGSVGSTVDHVIGLFNVVSLIYQNENLTTQISEIFVWDTPDDYIKTSLTAVYVDFSSKRYPYNGDLALLVSRDPELGGGIGAVNTLCTTYAYGYTNIGSNYEQLPTYSWSVHVMAHEIGHILGSLHTHDCVWNGDNTAIDACDATSCGIDIPEAGTIMSYCQGVSPMGVDFSLGFGPQPGDLIRSRVTDATCLTACLPDLSVQLEKTGIDCHGGEGSITVLAEGGSGSYQYLWSNGDTSAVIIGLPAGGYSVTVTDESGSEITVSDSLVQPDKLQLHTSLNDQTYPGSFDGSVEVAIEGGTAPYNAAWSNGVEAESVVGLEEGVYHVTVTDAKGCELLDTFRVRTAYCFDLLTTFPLYDGLESDIKFGNQNVDDDFDWSVHSMDTPTHETGPDNAFEGSFYLYLEATEEENATAIITSRCFKLSEINDPALSFAYHMFGSQMGTLDIEISENFGETWINIWSLSGNQGKAWQREIIDLSSYSSPVIQIRFVGNTSGDTSDMAIDAVQLAEKEDVISSIAFFHHEGEDKYSVSPNPSNGMLNISIESEMNTFGIFKATNVSGQVVYKLEVKINGGRNDFSFDFTKLQAGIYFLTLERIEQMPITKKFIIMN